MTTATTAPTMPVTAYLSDVHLLCTQCQQPIRARINTCNWIRAEWIGPSGECLGCYRAAKAVTAGGENDDRTGSNGAGDRG